MSEEATIVDAPQIAEGTRSPVEKPVSKEVVTNNQETNKEMPDVNSLIAESKKYRKRSQADRAELEALQSQISSEREKQMESQNEWQALAEERASKIAELEPIVKRAMQEEIEMRENILSQFSQEDRDNFGDLPLPKLKVLQSKLYAKEPRLTVANNPAVPANEVPQDWTKMDRNQRVSNWAKIIDSYRK